MNVDKFCEACESSREPTKIFYHGTALVLQKTLDDRIMTPTSIDLGNAFVKPGRSIFMWKTEREALIWAVGDLLILFNEWLDDISEKGRIDPKTIACQIFEPDNALIDTDKFKFHPWWDRVGNCWIISDTEKDNFNRVLDYFDKHMIGTYVLKLETRAKYVSIGQTATLREYTTRDPATRIIDFTHYRVSRELIEMSCEVVIDTYFNEDEAIGDAALMNRGILSFFNTNEFDINARYNEKIGEMRSEFNFNPTVDINEYMKNNNIKVIKMYPIERVYRTIKAKKYLKRRYGI